jgi:hypothetical protein
MRFHDFTFGSLQIDDTVYEHDVVVDRGKIRKRDKNPSKKFRGEFAHTPLSLQENIPWKCRRLVVGTGAQGGLPVMKEVKREAKERGIELFVLPTAQAIEMLTEDVDDTNAVLHITC